MTTGTTAERAIKKRPAGTAKAAWMTAKTAEKAEKAVTTVMGHYLNFYFRDLEYDDSFYGGTFTAPDDDVACKFLYDREKRQIIDIWDNTQPVEGIMQDMTMSIYWLDRKLEKNGKLEKNESRICYL